jgi:hypothetical protein
MSLQVGPSSHLLSEIPIRISLPPPPDPPTFRLHLIGAVIHGKTFYQTTRRHIPENVNLPPH